jgi:hypothetical protein
MSINRGNKSMMHEHPPSFYEDDLERYRNKFRASIENRQHFKKKVEKIFRSKEGGSTSFEGEIWHQILAKKK